MSMARLPVPSLEETLARFARSASVLLESEAMAAAEGDIARFLGGTAEGLQTELEAFARHEGDAGRSWLSDEWSLQYMNARDPLPLVSNVAFQLRLSGAGDVPGSRDSNGEGVEATNEDRLAEIVHRIAALHLAGARGDVEPEVDARGTELSMEQWRCFSGGIRHPDSETDTFLPCELGAARREIGVLLQGRLFALGISDGEGRPLGCHGLAAAFRSILESAEASAAEDPSEPSFADLSYLGSDALAPVLESMLVEARNTDTYERLKNMLFTVTLTNDAAGTSDAERLRHVLVDSGRAWVMKPLGYQLDLHDERVYVHTEHSCLDGGTLVDAVGRMQGVLPEQGSGEISEPEELRWLIDEPERHELRRAMAPYRDRAARLRIEIVRVPRVPADRLPFPMSADALQQLIMTVAQLLSFGRLRSVYESVDTRAFQAGRTECLRPVTPEASAFARALLAGQADSDSLTAALNAHREWVKACKTGRGFDRHLTGLAMIAKRQGVEAPFFSSDAVTAVQSDLLSTTSLGTAEQVVRYAFAPTTSHGFGIAYTPHADAFEFTVSYDAERSEQPERFLRALREAAGLLHDFLSGGQGLKPD